MSRGKIAAQVAHAAVLAALNGLGTPDFATWLEQGQPKVVLKVGEVNELRRLAEAVKQAGLPISLVADAGRTQLSRAPLPAPRSARRKTAGSTPSPVIYHCCERTDRGVAVTLPLAAAPQSDPRALITPPPNTDLLRERGTIYRALQLPP